jgi:hypothetical protein
MQQKYEMLDRLNAQLTQKQNLQYVKLAIKKKEFSVDEELLYMRKQRDDEIKKLISDPLETHRMSDQYSVNLG